MKRLVSLAAAFLLFPRVAGANEPPDPGATGLQPTPEPAAETPPAAPEASSEKPKAPEPEPEKAVEVSVVGTRTAQTAGAAHVIGSKQLGRLRYDDPHAVLLQVPGVYIRGEDGMGLRPNVGIRGANPDRSKKLTLTEDGILFGPAPYSAPAAYYFPLIQRMQAVRVIKGPAAISFGPQTVGGAIDVVTRAIPTRATGSADLSLGQFGYQKIQALAGYGNDQVGFLIDGIHVGNTGFKQLDGGGDTGFVRNEWMVKGRYVLDPDAAVLHQFEVKLGYSDETSNETYLGLSDAEFRQNPWRRYLASRLDKMEWHRTQLALTHRVFPRPNLEIATTVYRHDLSRIWRKVNGLRGTKLPDVLADPDSPRNSLYMGILDGSVDATSDAEAILIGPNDRRYVSQGVQTLLRWNPTTGSVKHRIEVGTRLHYDSIRRVHTEDGFLMTGGQLVHDGRPTALNTDNAASTYAIAMHVVDAMTWRDLVVTPGVRAELFQSRLDDFLRERSTTAAEGVVLPGIGIYYGLLPSLGLLGGVHKGFSPPPPGERGALSEESYNYEAGARFATKQLRAEVIGFFSDYQNLTSICTFSGGCEDQDVDRQFNAGQARIYGLEAYAESELVTKSGLAFPGRISYTLTRTELLNDFKSGDPQLGTVEAGDELPYVPLHQLAVSAGIETKRWGINLAGTYVSAMREAAGQGEPKPGEATDPYFVLDAGAHFRVLRFLDIYANARNLLDEQYIVSRRPFGARPGAPRWLQVGVRFEL